MSKKPKEIKAPTKPQPPENPNDWVNSDRDHEQPEKRAVSVRVHQEPPETRPVRIQSGPPTEKLLAMFASRKPGKASESIDSEAEAEPLVRLTFDIPESLHRRIKINCAQRGIKRMAVELRRILNQHFPA
jgi:hypothetical protein